jgi:hypothetical protein
MKTKQKSACGVPGCPCRLQSPRQVREFLGRIRQVYTVRTYGDLDDVLFQLMSRRPQEVPAALDLTQPEIQELITHLGKLHYKQVTGALKSGRGRWPFILVAAATAVVMALFLLS